MGHRPGFTLYRTHHLIDFHKAFWQAFQAPMGAVLLIGDGIDVFHDVGFIGVYFWFKPIKLHAFNQRELRKSHAI